METDKINLILDRAIDFFEDESKVHYWLEHEDKYLRDRPIDLIAKGALDKLLQRLDN
jgi:uncharacterized protein (DUF2384 family)